MTELIAKPVIKNKFWIVEDNGAKVGTIQAVDESGGYAYVKEDQREIFPTIKILTQKYNIHFAKSDAGKSPEASNDVYGYPAQGRIHNAILDVQRYLPIYTKTAKSKSCYCAGYYLIKYGRSWTREFCPKLITLNRYEYQGPFKTEERARDAQEQLRG